ncbi:MAG: Ig-like domain-containing protein [Kofleriaceae bacterium]
MSPRPIIVVVLAIAGLAIASPASAQRGVPQSGFPSWQERLLVVYVNRARADPAADLAGCTMCAEKACYASPLTPVVPSYELERAARFHAGNLEHANRFQHDSPCTLVGNLSSLYVPQGSCQGEVACACEGGMLTGSTPTQTRLTRFAAVSSWGENIAYGYATPRQTFYQWFWEADANPACGFRGSNGHRYNIMNPGHRVLGDGYYRITRHMWVQDFNSGADPSGTLLAGAHEPQTTGGTVEFRANYFDTAAPQEATVNIDGACVTMARERGSATNGTYHASTSLPGTACRRYRFEFKNPAGAIVVLPETGSYGAGGAGCEDWTAATPPACGAPANQAPMIATPARATPAPVPGTTTQLSVLGADDGGESALVYTWAATGPAAVTITPNGSNAARGATATFGRAGTYSFTVTLRDGGDLTVTSTVEVVVAQTVTTLAVAPGTASVPVSATQQFAATAYDQFARALTTQPTRSWTVSGGGSIESDGKFTAGSTVGGPHTVTASAGGKQGTATVTVSGPNAPTVAQAATASPDPVTSTTTALAVLGAIAAGEGTLVYTWSGTGPAPVTFEPNGSNAAKAAVATFTSAGSYSLTAQLSDVSAQTATSSVTVTVESTPTTVDVMPRTAVVVINEARDFMAAVTDQFGQAAGLAPAWSVDGGGTVDAQGRFTAGPDTGGPFTLTATAGAATGSATFVVAEAPDTTPPTLAIVSPTDGAAVTGTTMLVAEPADDLGLARVVFEIEGQELTVTGPPWQIAWDSTTTGDGAHTITARAYDLADNPSVPSSIELVVDQTPETPDPGCGCQIDDPPSVIGLVLLGLFGLARRRRLSSRA